MTRSITAAVVCAVACALAPASGRAGDPPAGPKRLTNDELVKMVTRLGYEVKAIDKIFTQVIIERAGWRSVLRVSLSTDDTVVWADAVLVTATFPDAVPAATWLKLLARNEDLHPVAFSFNRQSKRLYLLHTLPNADITPAQLRKHLELLDQALEQTKDLWKLSNFVPPVPAEGLKQLDALAGKWKVVELNDTGTALPPDEAAKYSYTFDKDTFELLKDGKVIRKGQLVAATAGGTKQLDRYDTSLAVQGIYKLDGDTLTWCFSSLGRPNGYGGDVRIGTSLYVMTRDK